jgi:hypothetical protein
LQQPHRQAGGSVTRWWPTAYDRPELLAEGNRFFAPLGIAPGEVAVLDLSMPGRIKLSTGVLVMYADDESFTLMTPQGHMFAVGSRSAPTPRRGSRWRTRRC